MVIGPFKGKYRFLSNFWPANVTLDYEAYPSVEHAYQAAKTFSKEQRNKIRNARTPRAARRLGNSVDLREDWEEAKLGIMEYLVRQKFARVGFTEALMKTFPAKLIEYNSWGDRFWGVDSRTRQGKNHLGKILMKIRDEKVLKKD